MSTKAWHSRAQAAKSNLTPGAWLLALFNADCYFGHPGAPKAWLSFLCSFMFFSQISFHKKICLKHFWTEDMNSQIFCVCSYNVR